MNPITIALTGHRPSKLGGYNQQAHDKLASFCSTLVREIVPRHYPVKRYIIGMALGFDMAMARACLEHRIPYTAAIPCAGQSSVWPGPSQHEWAELTERATEKVVLAPAYSPTCMNERNEYMVDNADHLLALWDGSFGGTRNAVRYAQSRGTPVHNVWAAWSLHSVGGLF